MKITLLENWRVRAWQNLYRLPIRLIETNDGEER